MVALIPITCLIVGSSYGVCAAVVPLTLAATPFFARIVEGSLREVDHGLIEAAQAMGCNRKQIIWHVLFPEALPGIVTGFTVTLVTMINSSTIAGGLGDIAYRYSYQRLDMQIMFAVIVVLVMWVQMTGDRISQQLDKNTPLLRGFSTKIIDQFYILKSSFQMQMLITRQIHQYSSLLSSIIAIL